MMRYLFDTSAVIGLAERHSRALTELAERAVGQLVISPITLGELEHGVAVESTEERRTTLALASATMEHEFFDPTNGAQCYGTLRSVRTGVQSNDIWIAATAVTAGHTLVTQDRQLARAVDAVDWETTPWKTPEVVYVAVGE